MRYLGPVEKKYDGGIILETYGQEKMTGCDDELSFEAIDIEGTNVFVQAPIDRIRLAQIVELSGQSIQDHRTALEGLAH